MRHLQFYDNRPGFDFVHLHESEALGAGEPFFRLVVLEFEEDSCACGVRADRVSHGQRRPSPRRSPIAASAWVSDAWRDYGAILARR